MFVLGRSRPVRGCRSSSTSATIGEGARWCSRWFRSATDSNGHRRNVKTGCRSEVLVRCDLLALIPRAKAAEGRSRNKRPETMSDQRRPERSGATPPRAQEATKPMRNHVRRTSARAERSNPAKSAGGDQTDEKPCPTNVGPSGAEQHRAQTTGVASRNMARIARPMMNRLPPP